MARNWLIERSVHRPVGLLICGASACRAAPGSSSSTNRIVGRVATPQGDPFGVTIVVLRLDVGPDILGRHQPHVVTVSSEHAAEMMVAATGPPSPPRKAKASPLSAIQGLALRAWRKTTAPDGIETDEAANILAKIDAKDEILVLIPFLLLKMRASVAHIAGRRASHSIKRDRGWGRRGLGCCASDKTQIIRLVRQSPWPARRTLEKLGIPRSSFYRWYDRYQRGGPEALADRPSRPDRVWSRIPEAIRSQIVDLALDQPELSPRELAVRLLDEENTLSQRLPVYQLLESTRSHRQPGSSPAKPISSSRRPRSSGQNHGSPTSFGRPTSPISKI